MQRPSRTDERQAAEAARRRADVDGMAGLANRMRFEDRLACLCREDGGLLMLLDLDDLKAVNDGFGHAAGDACLREAARRMAGLCREADLVARIGGDAFAILLGGDLAVGVAGALAERIVAAVGHPMGIGGGRVRFGASVGIAAIAGGSPADTFARADAALYAAKGAGRNPFRTDGAPIRTG